MGMLNLAVRLGLKRLSGVVWVSQRFVLAYPKANLEDRSLASSCAHHAPASSGSTGKAEDCHNLPPWLNVGKALTLQKAATPIG